MSRQLYHRVEGDVMLKAELYWDGFWEHAPNPPNYFRFLEGKGGGKCRVMGHPYWLLTPKAKARLDILLRRDHHLVAFWAVQNNIPWK